MRVAPLARWRYAALALLPFATPAAAQGLQVAAPQEIVAGTLSCAAATSDGGVDERKLEADGWRRGTMSGGDKAAESLHFYGKGKLLLTLGTGPGNVCILMARIQDPATFGTVAAEMDKGLATARTTRPDEANTLYWFKPGNIVQLALTGKPGAPSVRVAVGYFAGEKK